jgi:hypothetical protein
LFDLTWFGSNRGLLSSYPKGGNDWVAVANTVQGFCAVKQNGNMECAGADDYTSSIPSQNLAIYTNQFDVGGTVGSGFA